MADVTNGEGKPSNAARGQYRRWFAEATPEELPSDEALLALAEAMTLPNNVENEGPNPYESGIPAAYTYFGQFVAHDLSGDPASAEPECPARPATVSTRTPLLDLDALYGAGPAALPNFFDADGSFKLGRGFNTGTSAGNLACARDIPRAGESASIVEVRNDAHRIISQMHDILMRFHNRMLALLPAGEGRFELARNEVRRHYQWLVLHDFLPKVLHAPSEVDEATGPQDFQAFPGGGEPYTPVEFAAAAFRFGHSMVRAGYRLNREVDSSFKILLPTRVDSLIGFASAPALWGIDWDLFIDLSNKPRGWTSQHRLQLAHRIDTVLVNPLGSLPPPLLGPTGAGANLALRNLRRGRGLRLPSGQAVARALGLEPLEDARILIGSARQGIADVHASLAGKCPLWVYVLAEAVPETTSLQTLQGEQQLTTRKLGPVGSRIVRKTIHGLLQADPESVLRKAQWQPNPAFALKGDFGLAELLRAALAPEA